MRHAGVREAWRALLLAGCTLFLTAEGSWTTEEGTFLRGKGPNGPPPERNLHFPPLQLERDNQVFGWAWLDGPDIRKLAVRFLPSTPSGRPNPVETVSPSGPGSQMALRGVVLPEGRILLAWSAFDGEDDEIFWSLRETSGRWWPPARAHGDNQVPDITPALLVFQGSALLAWSRFETGEYRTRLAVFEDPSFQELGWVGEGGLLFPEFIQNLGPPLLLLRNAKRPGWTLFELNSLGKTSRRLDVEASEPKAPKVARTPNGLRLQWDAKTVDAVWNHP